MCRLWMPVSAVLFAAVVCSAAPATQPAEPAQGELLILPIAAPANGSMPWVGRSIQQDLQADLSEASKLRVVAPASAAPAADLQDALRAGRDAGAAFVLFGQSQISANQLRVTGNLVDVASDKTLGAVKATAPIDDLFPLEDSLAVQAVGALPPALRVAPPAAVTQGAVSQPHVSTAVPVPQVQPNQYPSAPYAPPYYSYTEPLPDSYYYDYSYGYPSYWAFGYYPWWWGPDVFILRDHDDFYHHHEFYDGGHFGHGPYYSPRPVPHVGGFGRGPVGHEFGHYGIGGPNVMGHGFGGARPGFGGGAAGGGHAGGGHER